MIRAISTLARLTLASALALALTVGSSMTHLLWPVPRATAHRVGRFQGPITVHAEARARDDALNYRRFGRIVGGVSAEPYPLRRYRLLSDHRPKRQLVSIASSSSTTPVSSRSIRRYSSTRLRPQFNA